MVDTRRYDESLDGSSYKGHSRISCSTLCGDNMVCGVVPISYCSIERIILTGVRCDGYTIDIDIEDNDTSDYGGGRP